MSSVDLPVPFWPTIAKREAMLCDDDEYHYVAADSGMTYSILKGRPW